MSSLDKNFASSDVYGGIAGEIDVNVISLDEYLEEYGEAELPCIIKIDAENNDFNVLKGAIKTIKRFKPSIIIEINDTTRNNIIEFMLNIDYSCFILTYNGKTLVAYNSKEYNQFKGNNDLLFVSDSKLIERLQKLL